MKEIPLTYGFVALVDDEDYERLACVKWRVTFHGGHPYAEHVHKGVCIAMHRYIVNAKKGEVVHHINGDTLDNQSRNLQKCLPSEHRKLHTNRDKWTPDEMLRDYYDGPQVTIGIRECGNNC